MSPTHKNIIIGGIVIVLLLVGGGIYLYANKDQALQQENASPQEQPTEQPLPEATKSNSFLRLLSPADSSNLCIGTQTNIAWEGSTNILAVHVFFGKPGVEYSIGTYPVSSNEEGLDNGKGAIPWKAGAVLMGAFEKEGFGYYIRISGELPNLGEVHDKNGKYFSLTNCQG